MRGKPVRIVKDEQQIIKRKMYFRSHEVIHNLHKCQGCEICKTSCPEEAISISGAEIKDGKLIKKNKAVFDENKCTFCGVCSQVCPYHAIEFRIDGKPSPPVLQEDFPKFIREVYINQEKCDPTCTLCQDTCKFEALRYEDGDGEIEILDVKINDELCNLCRKCEAPGVEITDKVYISYDKFTDETLKALEKCPQGAIAINRERRRERLIKVDLDKCVTCGWCEGVCPNGVLAVTTPFEGTLSIDITKCTEACTACIEACPCGALHGSPLVYKSEYCILCGACRNACPNGAIAITRERIRHTKAHSGTWFRVLSNLTSVRAYAKELHAEGYNRTANSLLNIIRGSGGK